MHTVTKMIMEKINIDPEFQSQKTYRLSCPFIMLKPLIVMHHIPNQCSGCQFIKLSKLLDQLDNLPYKSLSKGQELFLFYQIDLNLMHESVVLYFIYLINYSLGEQLFWINYILKFYPKQINKDRLYSRQGGTNGYSERGYNGQG